MAQSVPVSVSFSGCGFLGVFHVGVAACFRQHGHLLRVTHALGASAGAIVAAALALNIDPQVLRERFHRVAKLVRASPALGAFHPSIDLNAIFVREMHELLPPSAHSDVSGRVTISLTNVAGGVRNVLVSHFDSRQDLMDAIVCSCFIPGFSSYRVPSFRGKPCIDGGFSNVQPVLDAATIRVSPFSGFSTHICPHDAADAGSYTLTKLGGERIALTQANAVRLVRSLAPADNLDQLYEDGFACARRFLETENLQNFRVDCDEERQASGR